MLLAGSSISFPYVRDNVPGGYVLRPKIPIVFVNVENKVEVLALVDSGADVSIVPKDLAEALQLDLSGKSYSIGDFHRRNVEVVNVFVNVHIQKKDTIFRISNMPVKVSMSNDEQPEGVILGRDGFFKEFDITFRENAGRIELAKIRR